jgi:hypothetical protein
LEDKLTGRELREWMVIAGEQIIGPERLDFAAGIIASTVFNVNRGRGTPPTSARDFMPYQDAQPVEKVVTLAEFAAEMGARSKRGAA